MADKKIIDLERLQQFLSKCDARYIRYGKKVYDGTLGAGTSDLAENLIATKGLTVNDDPMSYGVVGGAQKSAVGNGNASLNKLVCVDVVKNQITPNFTGGTYNTTTVDPGYDYETFASNIYDQNSNHTWLFVVFVTSISSNCAAFLRFPILFYNLHAGANFAISTSLNSANLRFAYQSTDGNAATVTLPNNAIKSIDLTQRYGSNGVVNAIIGSGTDAEKVANLLAFDPEILSDLSYDAGTLVPSKTAKLLSVGVNQWDEKVKQGYYSNGVYYNVSGSICSENPIPVFGGKPVYFYFGASDMPYNAVNEFDAGMNFIKSGFYYPNSPYTPSANCSFIVFNIPTAYGTVYNHDICINISDPNINGKYYPYEANPVTLPNYEGHGILKAVDGKVVADGTELYPDGNSKKRWNAINLGAQEWSKVDTNLFSCAPANIKQTRGHNFLCAIYSNAGYVSTSEMGNMTGEIWSDGRFIVRNESYDNASSFTSAMSGVYLVYPLATEEDITTSVYQANFPVEQGGTLQFLDENDNPIAGLQGSEIFYQKNIKAFVEAFGEAIDWDPARIERLANLSFTPEYTNITLNPSPTGAYARAQVYNATFTIVISASFSGTANGSITMQDSVIDLSTEFPNTKPAEKIIDADGKPASEAPTTPDCPIAYFVGRTKDGTLRWCLLHSAANEIKVHFEETVPLDANGSGIIDCRASLIL